MRVEPDSVRTFVALGDAESSLGDAESSMGDAKGSYLCRVVLPRLLPRHVQPGQIVRGHLTPRRRVKHHQLA